MMNSSNRLQSSDDNGKYIATEMSKLFVVACQNTTGEDSCSPLDCKEIRPLNPKGNQVLIFYGSIVAEAEASVLGLPDAKSRLIGKDPDAGRD